MRKNVEGGIFYNFPGMTEKEKLSFTSKPEVFHIFSFAGWKEQQFKCEISLALSSLSNFSIVSYAD